MKRTTLLLLALLCMGLCSTAIAGKRDMTGTTSPTQQIWPIGRVVCNDPRILDLTGVYTLTGTSHTVRLSIVQDPRGMLVSTATITLRDGRTTGPFHCSGRLKVGSVGPLSMSLAGGRGLAPAPTSADVTLPGIASVPLLTINGIYEAGAFRNRVTISGFGPFERFQAPLRPLKDARGFVVSDANTIRLTPLGLLTTRTVTLPWMQLRMNAVQPRSNLPLQLVMPAWRTGRDLLQQPAFAMELTGALSTTGFQTRRNVVRLGYGALDVTTGTAVFRSQADR